MKVYLVGGAVRDLLLGIPVKEKDWVVVGATDVEMINRGFKRVGKDFPVFLHPQSREEYALARRERKISGGYTGFEFDSSQDVTLEEDLSRRDLTINAIAMDEDKKLIDPFGGKKDIEARLLRHVTEAFVEDPVRILRVARFCARFHDLGFKVAEETLALMKQMVANGEINFLVPERVWKEFEKAISEKNPEMFIQTLQDCNALKILFPFLQNNHASLQALINASRSGYNPVAKFAALFYASELDVLKAMLTAYKIPNVFGELSLLTATYYKKYQQGGAFEASEILDFFYALDAFRRPERFFVFLDACDSIPENQELKNKTYFQELFLSVKEVRLKDEEMKNIKGKAIADKLYESRLTVLQDYLRAKHR